MAVIRYSNLFDLARRVIGLACGALVAVALIEVIGKPYKAAWSHFKEDTAGWWLFAVLNLVWQISLFIYILVLLYRHIFSDTLVAWLYANLRLRTPVRWSEAKKIASLFCLGDDGRWLPCTHVLEHPRAERKTLLFDIADKFRKKA